MRVPFGVEVVQVTPSARRDGLRAVGDAPGAGRAAVEGRPAPGFVVGPMTAEPRTVEVIGPESAVKRATEALTEPVSVAGAQEPR